MGRPTSVTEMQRVLARFRTRGAWERGVNLEVRPNDVFIATYPKCGTTWVQQIVHQLRSGGSMEFDEISAVVPWLESAWDLGIDPAADQRWEPRAFKSHFHWEEIPKGGRYIHITRDPADVLRSFYEFFEGWFFETGSISLEEFARDFFMSGSRSGRYWAHVLAWWPQRDNPDVLMMAYEDMVAAPEQAVRRIAAFIGIEVEDRIAAANAQSSRDFMTAHPTKFDEHLTREARDHIWGLPPGGTSSKVVGHGPRTEVAPQVRRELDEIWAAEVTPATGLGDYESLRRALG